jgi:UDP-N-acetylglucosamine--N-acetylmuramyl-(pentapeptide) pyrophosphoryl-undecaprenol N-acetylglucosamine transferase
VRQKIVAALERVVTAETISEKLRILVVGGSQGARAVSDLVTGAQPLLSTPRKWISPSCTKPAARISNAFKNATATLGLADRVVVKAFIDDMATAYAEADLVVARAGALTLAELAIAGNPPSSSRCPPPRTTISARTPRSLPAPAPQLVLDQGTCPRRGFGDRDGRPGEGQRETGRHGRGHARLARPQAAQAIVDRLEALA